MKKILIGSIIFSLTIMNCGKVKDDPEITASITKAVANCEVDTRYASLKNCKENADKDLKDMIKNKGPAASLPSLAVALNNDDIKVAATAASVMYSNIKDYMTKVSEKPESVDGKVLDLFMKGLEKYKSEYFTMYAVRSVVHLAMIKGDKKIIGFLKSHSEKAVKSEGLTYLMQFGRMKVFDEVKELAGDKETVRIALKNPRNMYKLSADEEKTVCDWAMGFLDSEDMTASGNAAMTIATRCKGEYLDKLLDKVEKAAEAGELKGDYKSSLTNFSFSCQSFMGSQPTGTTEQCERKAKILEKAQ
ncbi:MAG: hypothetical protein KDK36_03160 [Leptospiraceae bacterium]|nr:hypothetical protein [Leptospiraceae bacterium]